MRRYDCAGAAKGYISRIRAVFECLVSDFAADQVAQRGAERNAVSLVEMQAGRARLVFDRQPLTRQFLRDLSFFVDRYSSPQGDACYLGALDLVQELTKKDTREDYAVVVCFLSDGVPSDRLSYTAESLVAYGLEPDTVARLAEMEEDRSHGDTKGGLHAKATAVYSEVFGARMQQLLRSIGPSRFRALSCGFGPNKDEFRILKSMAVSVNGRFSHATLENAELSKIFRTLSSTLTEVGGLGK